MVRPTRQIVMSAVLGAALAGSPVRADDKSEPAKPAPDATKASDDVKRQLEDIRADIKSLQTFRKDLDDVVFGKKDGATGLDAGLLKRLSDIEAAIKRIDERLAKLDGKAGDPSRSSTSGYGTPAPAAPASPTTPAAGRAGVRIINEYPVEMTMVVNNAAHRVAPGAVKFVDVPPGSYTYELLNAGTQPTTSTIKEGETVTLRIR